MAHRSRRHTHKYYKGKLGYDRVWTCALPNCNHYMPLHMETMVNGKASICWQCGGEFILHPLNMREERPRCDNCHLGIVEQEVDLPLSPAMKERLESEETARIRPSAASIRNFITGKSD